MKLKEYLVESDVLFISSKDLPEWAKKILKDHGISGSVKVHSGTEFSYPHNWHDANVQKVYFWYGGNSVQGFNAANQEDYTVSTPTQRAAYNGEVKIPLVDKEGLRKPLMFLVTNTYPKNAEIYVHPNMMPKQMEGPTEDKFTDEEKAVLYAIKCYLSAYRVDRLNSTCRINKQKYDQIVSQLKAKKALMGNGAMTPETKTFISNESQKDGSMYLENIGKKIRSKS